MRTDPEPRPLPQTQIHLSVVAPAHNESENIDELIAQVEGALLGLGRPFEFIIVDDGSTDDTRRRVAANLPARPWVRCVAMTGAPPGSGHGQSAAFHAGLRAARGRLIALLDADLQNDPADIPRMLALLEESGADLVQGDRSAVRKQGDPGVRLLGSWVGRGFRRALLGDTIIDTGCSLRVMKREVALRLPLEFKGMHRFIPATARHLGYTVIETPVNHRPRHAGTPKYGLGITKRALPGLVDLLAVRYMRSRRRPVSCVEHHHPERAPAPQSQPDAHMAPSHSREHAAP